MFGKIKQLFERVSPVTIDTDTTSLTVGISKRFLLFEAARKLARRIEDEPHLNFIASLKRYKSFGNILTGTIWELYRDRNRSYFRNFFTEAELYRDVKRDLEWAYSINKEIIVTITKRGVIIYDNYKKNNFNILLLTPHSGTWLPRSVDKKQTVDAAARMRIEDTDSHKIYGGMVLEKSGIWIDSKLSRFGCDFNRDPERAIYSDDSEPWIENLWKEPLTKDERDWLITGYNEFYVTLTKLIESFRFNIIFDGHTMLDAPDRADVSFGTQYIPEFYMPVVASMRDKVKSLGYKDVAFNRPFSGGYILRWMHNRFPDVFVFSIEINKKLYMKGEGYTERDEKKTQALASVIKDIFDIEVEV